MPALPPATAGRQHRVHVRQGPHAAQSCAALCRCGAARNRAFAFISALKYLLKYLFQQANVITHKYNALLLPAGRKSCAARVCSLACGGKAGAYCAPRGQQRQPRQYSCSTWPRGGTAAEAACAACSGTAERCGVEHCNAFVCVVCLCMPSYASVCLRTCLILLRMAYWCKIHCSKLYGSHMYRNLHLICIVCALKMRCTGWILLLGPRARPSLRWPGAIRCNACACSPASMS